MNVIEYNTSEYAALNGWFKNSGCGLFKSSVTCPKVEVKKANDNIEIIKSEEGFNDLMYMKPEQAARTLNAIIERIAYNRAIQKEKASKARGKDSVNGHNESAKVYGKAIGEVISQFRQYALGMNGEIKKLGENQKKVNGVGFTVPFFKMVLPVTSKGSNPVAAVSKEELIGQLTRKNPDMSAPAPATNNNMMLYAGAGIGILALIGGAVYFLKRKK